MNGLLTKQTYGNGDKVEFTYDILGRAKTTTHKDENGNVDRVLTYVYTGDGQLYSIHDSRTGFLYLCTYDSIGRLIGSSVKNADGEVLMSTRQEYNANNQLVGQHWTVGSTTYSETYTYSTTDGALTSYNNALGETVTLNYDPLRRVSSVTGGIYERKYNYRDVATDKTTSFVSGYHYKDENGLPVYSFSYTYDVLGNIASQTDASGTQIYTYDDQNQLTKVKNAAGTLLYEYTYDNAGNILTASNGTATNSYTYGNAIWEDLLTAYNGNYIAYEGQTVSNGVVTGDVIGGNPISYYNGKRYAFTWEEGRNLVSAVEGTNTYAYTYDSNGLRVSKTVNGIKHEYLYASGKLLRDTYGNVILDFVYDNSGHPYALIYNNGTTTQTYYYITNLQGDVLYLLDSDKQVVASYSYDPYGKPLDSAADGTMTAINPLRYRGYYYDAETGFYYLQSRYYDPEICKFVNADGYASTGQGIVGYNMFAYCINNPGIMADSKGDDAILVVDTGEYGIPVVGHSRVYFQDAGGEWYVTEVAGDFPYPWTAHVYFQKVSESRYSSEFNSIINGSPSDDISWIYLEGNFSNSKKVAEESQKKKFYYSLLFNSCHHYSLKILAEGDFTNPALEMTVWTSTTIIPTTFIVNLKHAQNTGHVPGTGYVYNGSEWEYYPALVPQRPY